MPAFGKPASAASTTSLRLQLEVELVARQARLREARRLTRRCRESARCLARPAPPRATTTRVHPDGEVGDEPAVAVEKLRPDGNAQLERLAVRSVLLCCRARYRRGPPLACLIAPERREVAQARVDGRRRRLRRGRRRRRRARPSGTYFSRRKLSPPSPPRPASTWMCARSWNMAPGRAESRAIPSQPRPR